MFLSAVASRRDYRHFHQGLRAVVHGHALQSVPGSGHRQQVKRVQAEMPFVRFAFTTDRQSQEGDDERVGRVDATGRRAG